MARFAFALLIILHGLVHLWYVVLSQRLVAFKPEMGWTGRSWLLTDLLGDAATRSAASLGYGVATVAFVASGIGFLARFEWWRPLLLGAAILSAAVTVLMWDGRPQRIVEKGLIGTLISLAILTALTLLQWPPARF